MGSMKDEQERQTYTIEEVAVILGIDRNSCYKAVARGDIPSIRVGFRILVPRTSLVKLLDATPKKS